MTTTSIAPVIHRSSVRMARYPGAIRSVVDDIWMDISIERRAWSSSPPFLWQSRTRALPAINDATAQTTVPPMTVSLAEKWSRRDAFAERHDRSCANARHSQEQALVSVHALALTFALSHSSGLGRNGSCAFAFWFEAPRSLVA
jgi:hypothetical protein